MKGKPLSPERKKEIDDVIERTLAYTPEERLEFIERTARELYEMGVREAGEEYLPEKKKGEKE
jgi:hypothetical protein